MLGAICVTINGKPHLAHFLSMRLCTWLNLHMLNSLWEPLFMKMFFVHCLQWQLREGIIVGLFAHISLLHYVAAVIKNPSAMECPLVPVVTGMSTGSHGSAYCRYTPLINNMVRLKKSWRFTSTLNSFFLQKEFFNVQGHPNVREREE